MLYSEYIELVQTTVESNAKLKCTSGFSFANFDLQFCVGTLHRAPQLLKRETSEKV